MNWQKVAIAIASRLQYEHACGRGRLIHEDYVRLALSEVFQALENGSLDFEYNHPDLPGNTRVDVLMRSPQAQNIIIAAEVKWVRTTTDTAARNWMVEVLRDAFRVERLSTEMVQASERAVVVVGESELMKNRIWRRQVNTGKGGRMPVVESLLQSRPAQGAVQDVATTVSIRHADPAFRGIIQEAAGEMANSLPSSLRVRLAGYHRGDEDGVEAVVWLVARAAGQRWTFDATAEWP